MGVVHHSGDIDFGHYTADCWDCNRGQWFNYNDSTVTEGGERWSGSSTYLLFYSKVA